MKFTLLEPCDYNFYYNNMSGPLGLAYVASFLDQELDNSVQTSIETDVDYVIKTKPDFVGISAYTQNFNKAIHAAKKIKKELNIPVIIGGKHITALPETLPDCFDLGVVGDGERTMADIMKTFIDTKGLRAEDLVKIQGVTFKDDGKSIITPQRDALKDLDFLPPPKRSILHAYWPFLNKRVIWQQGIYTSRGCPYKCPFCIHSKIQFVSRYHSPTRVVTEIEEILANFPEQKTILIYDDLFIISKKRLKEIRDIIVSEKINKRVSFTAMCKSNHFDEDIAIMLREMNVKLITFGFESGDEKTLQYLKKDSSKVSENLRAINLCNKYGIEIGGYFILGSEPETKEAMARTFWFMNSNFPPMTGIGPFSLTPFPGTKEWDNAVEKNLVNPLKEDWDAYNYIDYKTNAKVFMNNNYSFDFFKQNYEDWFLPLVNKNTLNKFDPENVEKKYAEIKRKLENLNIDSSSNILEVGTQHNTTLKDLFPDFKNITMFDHWIYRSTEEEIKNEKLEIENKKFDYIVFNFSLEQIIDPYTKLKDFIDKYLEDNGKIIIFIKNTQFINTVFEFLFNPWSNNMNGFKRHDNFMLLNIDKLKDTIISLDFNIKEILLKENNKTLPEIYNKILSLIESKVKIDSFNKISDISNYIFVAERKNG